MTVEAHLRILVIGYGNPGRLDDGLGPAFAERIQELNIPGVTIDADYQLAVEDAAAIAQHDIVLFADASVDGLEPFDLQPLAPQHSGLGFSSHSLSAAALLGLTQDLFGASPQAYLLAIRGYACHAFGDELSKQARMNMEAAVSHVAPLLRNHFAS